MIRVGLTEKHGMAAEQAQFPPEGVEYSFPAVMRAGSRIFTSPIKGYLSKFDLSGCDIVESVISPVITEKPWVYSLACYQEALAFDYFGVRTPRFLRNLFMQNLLCRENCKKLVFWSEAGKQTLKTYAGISNQTIWEKSVAVYPGIRSVDPALIRFNDDKVNILFSGDFFRKGGANVIDAFEEAQKRFPHISLRVCCDEKIDFNTSNEEMRQHYLDKIRSNPDITFGRVSRERMINEILPDTDIYLLPTYAETFGFAVLEAMAFGIPVISTNHMAIPEMIVDGESGFMIDTLKYDMEQMFRGYVINHIPDDFKNFVTHELAKRLCELVESADLRRFMGKAGIEITRTKFSFAARNEKMKTIYAEAMA